MPISQSAKQAQENSPPLDKLFLWERLPGETHKAYAAFLAYRNINPQKRSVFQAWWDSEARDMSDPLTAKKSIGRFPPGNWSDWCTKYNWVERAKSWDDEKARIREEIEIEYEREDYREYRKTLRDTAIAALQISFKINQALNIRLDENGQVLPDFQDVLTIDKISSTHLKNSSAIRIAQELWGGSIGVERIAQYLIAEGLLE